MKARLVPIRLPSGYLDKFDTILTVLKETYAQEVEFLEPIMLGDTVPDADGVILPNLEADIYTKLDIIKETIHIPIIVITTKFAVIRMMDWEGVTYLKRKGLEVYSPFSVELAKTIFRALALKREMVGRKFLIFQDTPGDGPISPDQFKIFYWWNDECTQDILIRFGVRIIRKPYGELTQKAFAISDDTIQDELKQRQFPHENVSKEALYASMRLFVALRNAIDEEDGVIGVGANCLNEAHNTDTTPCLAYNLLNEERGIICGLEGDTSSLIAQYIYGKTINSAIFTTNIYPFLSGMCALSHERISSFPAVEDPDNHALLVHCGYLGCSLCQSKSRNWKLRPSTFGTKLGKNSTSVDGDIEPGDITMCKLHYDFTEVQITPAKLEEYVQYPGSACLNGGLIRVEDGYRLMDKICSHHVVVLEGKREYQLKAVSEIFGIAVERL